MEITNRAITVSALKSDPAVFGVQKYDNDADWNVPGGMAPNGVCATRWLRRTSPDVSQLTPLAAWLVQHVPTCVAGNMPAFDSANRVRLYNGKTEADMLRAERRPNAESLIRMYDLDAVPCRIDDWRFSQIKPGQDDTDYWNVEAARMIATGAIRAEIGTEVYHVHGN